MLLACACGWLGCVPPWIHCDMSWCCHGVVAVPLQRALLKPRPLRSPWLRVLWRCMRMCSLTGKVSPCSCAPRPLPCDHPMCVAITDSMLLVHETLSMLSHHSAHLSQRVADA